ncbi:MAG: hypothetical protein GX294_05605 [Candidatus Cloacimonetes bacterium]|nr:hypothetical protein [Candidatus Cloacimonadota bacterium]
MKKHWIVFVFCLVVISISANVIDEARAVKSWLDIPFSAATFEAERDAKISEWENHVKGEFETTAQFEQRKKDASNRIAAINREYQQKIADARAAHENQHAKLRVRLQTLLNSSRETVVVSATLGRYNADTQKYVVSIPQRGFDVVVPLDKAPQVKDKFNQYQVKATRQLNEELEWEYLDARLEGPLGVFSSTDKAPALGQTSVTQSFFPPDLSATVSFSEPSGNDMLDAEETATITISIKNNGEGSGNMVEATFELLNAPGVSFARQIYFGEVKAGATVTKTLQLVAGMDTKDGTAQLKIRFSEQNDFAPNDVNLSFGTRALLAPDVYVSDIGIDDFNKNNKLEPGEQAEITVRLHNRGQGVAKNLNAQVLLGDAVFSLGDSATSFRLGDLEPGDYQDIKFMMVSAPTATALNVSLDLIESRQQFSKRNLPLNLAFNKVERTADQMVVTGRNQQSHISSAPALSIDIERDIPQRTEDKNRWGVIIGIENYRNVSPVSYAHRDAQWMKEYFMKVLGIPAANLYMKTDDAATLGELKAVFDKGGWLGKNAGKANSEIYIYFSGHGVPDADGKQAYLLPYDGNPNYAFSTAYRLEQFYDNLSQIKAKNITVFLDSCFSGANRESEIILADARAVFIVADPQATAKHVSVFSAANGNQISSGYADMQHGLFSYFLMKGLRGEADSNNDKKITQKELYEYLQENVSTQARRMGREQDPTLQSHDQSKVIVSW